MKERIDVLLVKRGFFSSREKAKAAIMAGEVYVDGKRAEKAGEMVKEDSKIEIKGNSLPYVSRGGLKLEKALQLFGIDVRGKIALDVGASTGGFTDCLLKHGAQKVYAVDVGYGQLHWSLRNDPRVVVMEKTNIRFLNALPEMVDIITIDVSFISLEIVVPAADKFLKSEGEIVALIKPQFEAGREKVGKKGIVRDKDVHKEVLEKIIKLFKNINYGVCGITYSPIKGAEGNIEYLIYGKKGKCDEKEIEVEKIVEEAFKNLWQEK
ncbi:TlyA family RNA methyltransferase [Caldanaerobacter subterraneus]|uniref:TlyA family RNA methyltransferase n=1 Tax=Caldanaerobacter subterraneus TaxID=911092 RepID=A0A7Y2L6W2_9THEO|nr:TlyA family RNA methyltransferase [Caldanaerobacter subterraneus]NNG66767.1 TlyA family RNA methyltransferase [Caldanaerobacter subterraneus]